MKFMPRARIKTVIAEIMEQSNRRTLWNGVICATLLAFLFLSTCMAQKFDYNKQAEFGNDGNIYVSSEQGKLIKMAELKHCSEASVAPDKQTVGCRVMQDQNFGNLVPSLKLEIYLKGGQKQTIEPGAPIGDWHFWKDGQQVAISFGSRPGRRTYALYDSATGHVVQTLAEPAEDSLLPQWAKGRAQLQDESVPTNSALTEERTKWIAKVMRQIGKIEPGMTRRDLLKIFVTEGGLSNRFQRTFVHQECPYIKVNVRFKAVNGELDGLKEDPDDVIESISRPYLEWAIAD